MSELRQLIKQSRNLKKEMLPATLRMSKELHSFIDELGDELSLSKQDVMLNLLREGVTIAVDELKLNQTEDIKLFNIPKEEGDTSYFLLNTNKRHDVTDQDDMLQNHIAAAYYDPWKKCIDRIKKDDYVFLYENGVGIIAYGVASGETLKKEKNGDPDECYYQKLSEFTVLKTPIDSHRIKTDLRQHIVFLRTMTELPPNASILIDNIERYE